MIELKNISKTYKSKKSKNTKALDNVSITFAEKGMTFILGKSGSGKSTLLNILGGLDKYDTGDMLILGKSSKDFTQADFDSYRNTYVGFIFQEFNILEDYDVYQNIVLALQLQQKEINKEKIDELLDKLELTELKKRKVNELSGGQKQRVAIARALIKEPKIILADEPTGNLDSKTGSQVMELLKEISKEKLVVMVSHDEDYANTYADRIIEIKDGKIEKDTKEVQAKETRENTYKTIKSHLPFKDSFKLGIGSLKHKKLKLLFTIILIIITLGFLSCVDTLSSHDFNTAHSKYLSEKNEQFIQVINQYIYKDEYGSIEMVPISVESKDKTIIKEKIKTTGYEVYEYNAKDLYIGTSNNLLHIKNTNTSGMYSYEDDSKNELVVVDDISKILKETLTGRNATSANEIVISNYVANLIIENGIEVHEKIIKNEFEESNYFYPKSYEEILNAEYNYYLGNEKIKIVGIINYDLTNTDQNYISNVLSKIYVGSEFINARKNVEYQGLKNSISTSVIIENINDKEIEDGFSYEYGLKLLDHEIEYFNGTSWVKTNSLNENEAILTIEQLTASDEDYYTNLQNYVSKYNDYEEAKKRFIANYVKEKNIIGKNITLKLFYGYSYDGGLFKEYNDIKVVGVYINDNTGDDIYYYSNSNYFSLNLLGNYKQKQVELSSILYPMTEKKDFKEATKLFPVDSEYAIKTTYSSVMYVEHNFMKTIQKLAFYVGLVFLAFTTFLIANFMFTSISYRKKEIGVLRALGSRNRDIVKIFLWEALTLSIISGTIASVLLVVVSNFMNTFIKSQISMLTTPFIVSIRQFIVIYLLVFTVTIISSILPIIKISRMKPIDAILKK